jgi:hypothetical protein
VRETMRAGSEFFDLALPAKRACIVSDMQAGRGWEMSPEHLAYMQVFARPGFSLPAFVSSSFVPLLLGPQHNAPTNHAVSGCQPGYAVCLRV